MKSPYKTLGIAIALSISILAITAFAWKNMQPTAQTQATTNSTLPSVTVYKTSSCGCCKKWVTHLEENGFNVVAKDVNSLQPYKEKAKLSPELASCHTAFVDGYAVEGHVPANDIKRLLNEKPDVTGITVPAMPIGSPGMEVPGRPADKYEVVSYKDGKKVGVFAKH